MSKGRNKLLNFNRIAFTSCSVVFIRFELAVLPYFSSRKKGYIIVSVHPSQLSFKLNLRQERAITDR